MTTTHQTHPHTRHPGIGPRIHPCWCCGIDVLTTLMPVLCSEACRTDWRQRYQLTYGTDIHQDHQVAAVLEFTEPLTTTQVTELKETWRANHANQPTRWQRLRDYIRRWPA